MCDEAATAPHSGRLSLGVTEVDTPSATISFRTSILLATLHRLIRRLLAAQESRASSVNDLCRLWIALSLLDPRVAVKERALLECIALQKQHRSIIQTDVAVPFCYYALLLMREGRKEQALAVVQLGRSLSTDNVILKFLESGAEWTV